jgi:hypothetical protein
MRKRRSRRCPACGLLTPLPALHWGQCSEVYQASKLAWDDPKRMALVEAGAKFLGRASRRA